MRIALLVTILGISLASPVLAQSTSSTQTPSSPNSGQNMPDATNSLPLGAATATETSPGDALGRTGNAAPLPTERTVVPAPSMP